MKYSTAIKARLKGIPSMTRMYGGHHTVIGTYSDLACYFRFEVGIFVGVDYDIINDVPKYNAHAVNMETGDLITNESIAVERSTYSDNMNTALDVVFNRLLDGMKDKKGVKV